MTMKQIFSKFKKKLEIPKKIDSYIEIINNTLKVTNKLYIEKIYDYVMSKIYNKIFPINQYDDDNQFYKQTIRLSWTNINHFMPD